MLVDTSVWIDHFRRRDAGLSDLLEHGQAECHPFIIGELACGNLKPREEILTLLRDLPSISIVDNEEAMLFIEAHRLGGSGLGWVDIHLLASSRLSGTVLWTRDRRLASVARRLGIAA